MSIRFNCPHCKKTLKVPTQHAGRQARCPGCKQAVNIPTLDPVVAAEIEEFAAAALTDEPKPQNVEAKDVGTVTFHCSFCDEEIEVSAELAGQQTPCPECRRIIKVPLPTKKEPLDWRKVTARGPAAGMRRDEPAAPEGAWGSTNASRVSSVAIQEAQELEKPPLTTKQWIKRGILVAGVLVVIGAGAWAFMHFRGQNLQNKAFTLALKSVPELGKSTLTNLHATEIHRALAEYLMREGQIGDARKHLAKAQALLNAEAAGKPSTDVESMALDLVLTWTDLFGTPAQAQAGERVAWAEAPKDLRATLNTISSPEARAETIRHLARKLAVRASMDDAKPLLETVALQLGTETSRPEMLAVVGLELFRARHRPEAELFALKAAGLYETGAAPRTATSPSLIGLLAALGQEKMAERTMGVAVARPESSNLSADARVGFATGWAFAGNHDQALRLAEALGAAPDRFAALLAVATATGATHPAETRKAVESAVAVVEKEMNGRVPDGWSLVRFSQAAAVAGITEPLTPIIENTSDVALRQRAEVELVRGQLQKSSTSSLDSLQSPEAAANPLVLEARARHAGQHGDAAAVLDAAGSLQPESLRPFGQIGVALGLQDRGK